jgi:hypothetical protein
MDAVEGNREFLTEWVDAKPGPVRLPVYYESPSEPFGRRCEAALLEQRRYAMPAPWAIREYRYVANVLMHPSTPDTPLIYGEWKIWYRNHEFMDPEIPPPESES